MTSLIGRISFLFCAALLFSCEEPDKAHRVTPDPNTPPDSLSPSPDDPKPSPPPAPSSGTTPPSSGSTTPQAPEDATPPASAGVFDSIYQATDQLLGKYVKPEMIEGVPQQLVDYESWRQDADDLQTLSDLVDQMESIDLTDVELNEQKAFWINAYNLITLLTIFENWDELSSKRARPFASILNIRWVEDGKENVWNHSDYSRTVAGRDVTLDQIEKQILLGEFGDARVHYAVNCASLGCPFLQSKAFRGSDLDETLDSLAYDFVNLGHDIQFSDADNELRVSELLYWYYSDGEINGQTFVGFKSYYDDQHPSVQIQGDGTDFRREFIRTFLDSRSGWTEDQINGAKIQRLPYDWKLNDHHLNTKDDSENE